MKHQFATLKVLVFLFSLTFISCRKKAGDEDKQPGSLRVSGYLYAPDAWHDQLKTDLSLITDLNLAFVNPGENGKVDITPAVAEVVQTAHNSDVRIFISLGGAGAPDTIANLLRNNRQAFVSDLITLVDTYDFDGVDVDIEGSLIDSTYGPFVSELSRQLKLRDKLLTAALARWNADLVADSTLLMLDVINLMSYDNTGPWDPGRPGPHSPYNIAVSDVEYFTQQRGVAPGKIMLGVPFYGYHFSADGVNAFTYSAIVSGYPGAEQRDQVSTGTGTIYYNGIHTIKQKVQFAKQMELAGIMIWELNQDASGDKSLLKAINDER